jgi:hypothetical protein
MKKTLFPFLLLIAFQSGAQITCYTNPLDIPPSGAPVAITPRAALGSDLAADRLVNRRKSLFFHEKLMQIQEPSALSFFGTDYTRNLSGYQKKPFVLNADVQTPIAIGGKRFTGKKGRWMSAIHVNPQFKIRIFQDDPSFPAGPEGDNSLPVRTPSTIPGITYYGALTRLWDNEETGSKFSFLHNLYFGFRAFHHSNGQDGYELDTIRAENEGKVNIYNGNFGEQIVFEVIVGGTTRLGSESIKNSNGNHRKLEKHNYKDGKQITLKMNRDKEMYWRLGYEFHPAKLSNQVFDSLSIYGRYRVNITLGWRILPTLSEFIGNGKEWCQVMSERKFERWRYTLNINYILDGDYKTGPSDALEDVKFLDASKRLNLWATAYWIMPQTRSSALFVQAGYYGSDNYNIYFAQSLWQFRFGLAFGVFNDSVEKDNL